MKVLFAISNEEISESIVKKYQAEYKQIISSKNVYYFNAILKEIQKDKTYDRIVISEDLEAFTHSQYDQIDKFIFDKLDSISDEASNGRGKDIPIILICTDRRQKSEPILVKLFGIGVYNALIGSNRSVEEVCALLNRPRTKKEAKEYYRIGSNDVNYSPESENDVSEVEIQNILNHYKKLGKDEDQYVESFDNIAEQYNDKQLRVISKVLPLNVRAVLEEKSPKYQKVMSFSNTISDDLRRNKEEEEGPTSRLLKPKIKDQVLSKPVVIPSEVNMEEVRKLAKVKRTVSLGHVHNKEELRRIPEEQTPITTSIAGQRIQLEHKYNPIVEQVPEPAQQAQPAQPIQGVEPVVEPAQQVQPAQPIQRVEPVVEPTQQVQPAQPIQRVEPVVEPTQQVQPAQPIQRVEPVVEPTQQVQPTQPIQRVEPVVEPTQQIQQAQPIEPVQKMEQTTQNLEDLEGSTEQAEVPKKRGRGRPRKYPVDATPKQVGPKRGRGRPRKTPIVIPELEHSVVNPLQQTGPIEPIQKVEPVVEPVQKVQPVEPVQNVEQGRQPNVIQPIEDVQKIVKPIQQAQPIKPIEPIEPTQRVEQKQVVEPLQRVQPVEPVQKTEPVVEPLQRVQPVEPVQKIEPVVEPVQQVQPVQPVQKTEPVAEPLQRVQPVEPVQKVEPVVEPVRQVQPIRPVSSVGDNTQVKPVSPIDGNNLAQPTKQMEENNQAKPTNPFSSVEPLRRTQQNANPMQSDQTNIPNQQAQNNNGIDGRLNSNVATNLHSTETQEEIKKEEIKEPDHHISDAIKNAKPLREHKPQVKEEVKLPTFEEIDKINSYGYTGITKDNKRNEYINTIDLSSILGSDKKLVAFLGTSKNGTSFIVNNLAELASSMGIKTAILDTTTNRNSYYIYTKNEESLREVALGSFDSLINKQPQGIQANKNLTVFTSLPDEDEKIIKVDEILETLARNYSLILIDTDFNTPIGYFKQAQELYLVQSLDILTIQPLTAFLRKLKSKNVLEERKIRIIINKAVKVRGIQEGTIIGGMAYYTDPAMSYMTELFDRNTVKYITIPFEDDTYIRYLENIINCEVSLKGYSKVFMQSLKELANMVYPLVPKGKQQNDYKPPSAANFGANNGNNGGFSSSMNNTLNQMKNNY